VLGVATTGAPDKRELEHLFVGELLRYVPSGVASAPVTDPARDLAMMR